jgi:hypothetical protein
MRRAKDQEKVMIRKVVPIGIFTVLVLAAGLTSAPASAFVTRDVHPIPFDGRTGAPAYQPQSPGVSCMVVGASCNKGPMPPASDSLGHWGHGYPNRDGGFPQQGWPKAAHSNGLGAPF